MLIKDRKEFIVGFIALLLGSAAIIHWRGLPDYVGLLAGSLVALATARIIASLACSEDRATRILAYVLCWRLLLIPRDAKRSIQALLDAEAKKEAEHNR